MTPPPEPHVSFTIPSIHDDTTLDCRIYHPNLLARRQTVEGTPLPWLKRGIIMAHPYAPLGGSYDDRIVGIVVSEFLKLGYVVGTFNFRGAHGSKSRTSWSGKPEISDYISYASLFIHYIAYIRPHPLPDAVEEEEFEMHPQEIQCTEPPTVIFGGYSHGSLIVQHLPPVSSILQSFSAPLPGSAADEIILRARKLAHQANVEWITSAREEQQKNKHKYNTRSSIAMGGEETSPNQRRSSRETRRSTDHQHLRKSLDIRHLGRKTRHKDTPNPPDRPGEKSGQAATAMRIQMPRVRYILISPLTGPVSFFVAPALSISPKFWSRRAETQTCDVFAKHKSLIIYGDKDMFSSAAKVRAWIERLSSEPGSRITHVEVEGAGHFWYEPGAEAKLKSGMRTWAIELWTKNEDDDPPAVCSDTCQRCHGRLC